MVMFFHSITRRMKFRIVVAVVSRKKSVLIHETKVVLNLYKVKDHTITTIHAAQEFGCIREEMGPIELNIYI